MSNNPDQRRQGSSRYFQNTDCEFFPCHEGAQRDDFSCLFCYCPLYALGAGCGGSFTYTDRGVKDCSGCLFPHRRENYDAVTEKCALVAELAKHR